MAVYTSNHKCLEMDSSARDPQPTFF